MGEEAQDAFLTVVGEQQRFQPGAVDAAEQFVHRRVGVGAVEHQRVVDVQQQAPVAQLVELFIVQGKDALSTYS